MKELWNRILNEPALLFTAIVTAYGAAIAAGWVPVQWLAVVIAAVFAFFGILVRQYVTPVRSLAVDDAEDDD